MKQISKKSSILIVILLIILTAFALFFTYQNLITSSEQCEALIGRRIEDDTCITLSGRRFKITPIDIKNKKLVLLKIDDIRSVLSIYYSNNRKYPESLESLVPKYMIDIPIDPFTNKPYFYSSNSDSSDYVISVRFDDGKVYSVNSKSKPGNY